MENLFRYQQIANMNERELAVYNYVSSHLKETGEMNIRELAAACRVSTTTVLRFCGKVGCEGYTEFKYRVRQTLEKEREMVNYADASIPAVQFLQSMAGNEKMDRKLCQAADWCVRARQVLFLGEGVSRTMGEYGARLFSSAGILTFTAADLCYPPPAKDMEDTVVFALSISGENARMISMINHYKRRKAAVISITNTDQCTAARISGLNFSYYMPLTFSWAEDSEASLTTQIPVVCLLETLAGKIAEKYK